MTAWLLCVSAAGQVTAGARVAGATVPPVVVAAAAAAAVGVQGAEDAVDFPVAAAAAAAAAKATMLLVAAALVAAVEQMVSGSRAAEASQWNRSWLVVDRSASNLRGCGQRYQPY